MAAILLRTTPLSQRAEPSPSWYGTFPKRRIRRGTTGISRVRCGKAKRGCASRVPRSLGVTAAPHERGAGGESDPPILGRWCTTGADKGGGPLPPLRGGRSLHSDPWREGHQAGQEAGAGQRRRDRPQLAHWPRPVPGGPWPLPPMSDAWYLTVASWPRVSCRDDP